MSHLQLTPVAPPPEDDRAIPIDVPDEPMTEAALRELELDRASDEGMIEPPVPGTDVPGPEVPGPEDKPREPVVEVPGPEDGPHDPTVEAPGRDDRPPIASTGSSAAGLSRTAGRAA